MSAIEDRQDRTEVSDPSDPLLTEFQQLKKDINDAESARADWKREAEQCYKFVATHQWTDDDKRLLEEQHRPAVTFNRIAPLVKAVSGLEVNNRQGIIYLPRKLDAQVNGLNETLTAAGRWVRDECYAEDEESECFRDLTKCGEGWTEMRMDYEEDPNGKIIKERIFPLEMGVNKGAFKANYSDARMIYRIREMVPDDVRTLLDLPDDVLDATLDASSWLNVGAGSPADGGKGNKRDYPNTTRTGVKGRLAKRDFVKFVQCQYWKRERIHVIATANDEEPLRLNSEDFAKFQQRADAAQLDYSHAQVTEKKFYQCFIGMKILEMKPLEMGMFQFQAMTGERDEDKKCFYGMVRDMIDPQQWSNKFLAQTMNIMNTNAKGGIIAETDAFVNARKAEREWSDPTKIIWAKPGTIAKQKIKERTPPPLPPGLDQLMMFAISSIRDVTGINLELLGQADREQAASLEAQRRQSAMTILATMFDSLRKYRKLDGKLMLRFIRLLPDNTLVRVLDQGQYKYIPVITSQIDINRYDVIIDEAPTSPDQKQFIWSVTSQILQMNILPPPAVIELLKYSPYPESVVQEIRKAMGMDGQMPPQMLQQRLQQAEQALKILEEKYVEALQDANKAKDTNALDLMQKQIDSYKAETERLSNEWNARVKEASAVIKTAASSQGAEGGAPAPQPQRAPPIDLEQPPVGTGDPNFQQLPGNGPDVAELALKLDVLSNMMGEFVNKFNGQQQQTGQVPPPQAQPPMEPDQDEGEA